LTECTKVLQLITMKNLLYPVN